MPETLRIRSAEADAPSAAAAEIPSPEPGIPPEGATPMMAQYLEIKAANPDCLLFYRMGDFYELFFDDAVAAAAALDIALTKRGRHRGEDIPMCGVPVHSADSYLERLIRKGFKVAVCEQIEDPAEARRRGGKSVVRRDVIRLVTPGTLTEDALLDARSHNYLAALASAGGNAELALAWLDISTGDFEAAPVGPGALGSALARLKPGELLVSERLIEEPSLFETFAELGRAVTPLPAARFDSQAGARRLGDLFGVATLEGFGQFSRAELAALGAVVAYAELTQKGRLPLIKPPVREESGDTMALDAATRRNLELDRTLSGERAGSLLSVIDRTVTGAGARLLARRLAAPLTDPRRIEARLDVVAFFAEAQDLRADVRRALRACPDLERALSRLGLGRGGPRDLAVIRDGLGQAGTLRDLLGTRPAGLAPLPDDLRCALDALGHHETLVGRLEDALSADLPLLARDGGFVRAGYHAGLDELRTLRDESRRVIAALEMRYRDETGIASLKIRHNNVLGYYIETTPAHADALMRPPRAATFLHRQTLANAVRFGSVELSELEARIREAGERALALELDLFADLVGEVTGRASAVAEAARGLAELDVASALAELAVERRYSRPKVDRSLAFRILGGRHPVVEAALSRRGDAPFVANECDLSAEADGRRLWLLTGPNMAGKSTFLRQNALIAILTQMGSFVPADEACIGVVDRLFSRVGAADDLARGRSTFMVEMVETAAILNQAGPRALVILDEIGRGTATFDGLSIAWAALEHLHEVNRCRALFATHYHELTALAETLPGLANHTMRVREWKGDVVFLHEVAPGAADRSYGIQVAKLAGLPPSVIARAQSVLDALERGGGGRRVAAIVDDLPLFAATARAEPPPASRGPSRIEQALAEIVPDELTPRAALDALYRLKAMLNE